jgi:hypothetical protein
MFKKIFKRLIQSNDQRYLQFLEECALSIQTGSPQLAMTMRRFAELKQQIDAQASNGDSAALDIENMDELATTVLDQVFDRIRQLVKLESETASVLTSADSQRFESHFTQVKNQQTAILRAYSTLHQAATGKLPSRLDENQHTRGDSPLDEAIDALQVEVRTAQRLKDELGI